MPPSPSMGAKLRVLRAQGYSRGLSHTFMAMRDRRRRRGITLHVLAGCFSARRRAAAGGAAGQGFRHRAGRRMMWPCQSGSTTIWGRLQTIGSFVAPMRESAAGPSNGCLLTTSRGAGVRTR
jgi:hypothetical protein